jgi:hypothetical protein
MAIVKRGDRYGVRVWDAGAGRHRWLGTFERLQDAKRAEADAIARSAFGGSLTVAEWARVWQDAYARGAVATRRTYRYACQQIVESIGSEKLAGVTRPDAKRLANAWSRNTTRVARTMWADALRDGLCQHNPFTSLRLETPKGRKDITALTERRSRSSPRSRESSMATTGRRPRRSSCSLLTPAYGQVSLPPCGGATSIFQTDGRRSVVRSMARAASRPRRAAAERLGHSSATKPDSTA